MKTILWISLALSFSAWAQFYPVNKVFCDGSTLFNSDGQIIRNFSFSSDCKTAALQARTLRGRFCDGYELLNVQGQSLQRFSFSSDCVEALRLADNSYDVTCNGGSLVDLRTGLLVERFSFSSDCREAVQKATYSLGAYCVSSQLKHVKRGLIRNLNYSTSCEKTLRQLSQGARFCDGSELYNSLGRLLHRFTFSDDCDRAVTTFP